MLIVDCRQSQCSASFKNLDVLLCLKYTSISRSRLSWSWARPIHKSTNGMPKIAEWLEATWNNDDLDAKLFDSIEPEEFAPSGPVNSTATQRNELGPKGSASPVNIAPKVSAVVALVMATCLISGALRDWN